MCLSASSASITGSVTLSSLARMVIRKQFALDHIMVKMKNFETEIYCGRIHGSMISLLIFYIYTAYILTCMIVTVHNIFVFYNMWLPNNCYYYYTRKVFLKKVQYNPKHILSIWLCCTSIQFPLFLIKGKTHMEYFVKMLYAKIIQNNVNDQM